MVSPSQREKINIEKNKKSTKKKEEGNNIIKEIKTVENNTNSYRMKTGERKLDNEGE